MKVIVSCSGKFHAFNLVEELEKNKIEVIFFTSYSSITNVFFKNFISRKDLELINPNSIRTNIFIAFGLKVFPFWNQIFNNLFDSWVSRKIKKMNADVFIGWSCMSEKSIKVAKSKGIITIVERGSAHIEVQNRLLHNAYREIGKDFSINPNTIKKEVNEYNIADFISIPSRFCWDTFIKKGVSESKLFLNPYGVSSHFNPVLFSNSTKTTFLFLGKLSIQKGVHLIFKVIEDLIDRKENFEFRFIGAIEKEINELVSPKIKNSEKVKFLGHINHYDLNEEIGKCDIAVIPSIQDGFAMVAVQILKVGLPVIISSNAGAEQLIVNEVNGWVITPNKNELLKIINRCIMNLSLIKNMRNSIIQDESVDLSWDQYGHRYIDFLKSLC